MSLSVSPSVYNLDSREMTLEESQSSINTDDFYGCTQEKAATHKCNESLIGQKRGQRASDES